MNTGHWVNKLSRPCNRIKVYNMILKLQKDKCKILSLLYETVEDNRKFTIYNRIQSKYNVDVYHLSYTVKICNSW